MRKTTKPVEKEKQAPELETVLRRKVIFLFQTLEPRKGGQTRQPCSRGKTRGVGAPPAALRSPALVGWLDAGITLIWYFQMRLKDGF